jgi:catechol 2,3-dioxygenase-like lactoylglutathione lyase family enzyme
MAFSVDAIDHVEVFVRDLEAAARWYNEALGLHEIHRWSPEPVMIGAGGTKLALFLQNGESGKDGGKSRWHRVAWRTDHDGFERAQQHLTQLNISFRGPVDHGLAHSIYFQDPDGHLLEITYYLEKE